MITVVQTVLLIDPPAFVIIIFLIKMPGPDALLCKRPFQYKLICDSRFCVNLYSSIQFITANFVAIFLSLFFTDVGSEWCFTKRKEAAVTSQQYWTFGNGTVSLQIILTCHGRKSTAEQNSLTEAPLHQVSLSSKWASMHNNDLNRLQPFFMVKITESKMWPTATETRATAPWMLMLLHG